MNEPRAGVLPPRRRPTTGLGLRFHLLGRAIAHAPTSMIGVALFPVWVTFVALSPLTPLAWIVLPVTGLVRAYANANRAAASALLGAPLAAPYRPAPSGSWLGRVWAIVRDPVSWRDALWLLEHAVVGFTLSMVQIALFLAGLLYLTYPFLYWVTPQNVFGKPFGVFELHSVAAAALLTPLAVVSFGLWYLTAVPLSRAEAAVTRSLLR